MNASVQPNQSGSLAPAEVEERFVNKMEELKLREIEREVRSAAIRSGLGYLNLVGLPIEQETLAIIPKERAQALRAVCYLKTKSELRVAAVDASATGLHEFILSLSAKHNLPVALYLVSPKSIEAALVLYEKLPRTAKRPSGIEVTQQQLTKFRENSLTLVDLAERVKTIPLTEMLSLIVAGATRAEATDIHIEAEETDVKVRYRIDGVLHTVANLPKETWKQLVSRIKLLAGLKINIEDRPQDGRISLSVSGANIDIRVSTVPTANGESVALRLLLSTSAKIEFEQLGLRGQPFTELKSQIIKPNGLIIVTGPTGSGKTTTMYAILQKLNTPETKIITLEDPIEYRIEGVNQSQIDADGGYNFVRGLKHALRQDPDIVMVGEIRDLETAEISIQATLTGHLVLSTLHTNDAAGAIPRFLSIGAKPYLLAPALNAIIGQRLVRRLCQNCKKEAELDGETLARVKKELAAIPEKSEYRPDPAHALSFYTGKGCSDCHGVGYRGRIGIFEVMIMNPDLEKAILAGNTSEYDLNNIARQRGMLSMTQDGILKASEGITSVAEVFRVTSGTRQ